MSAEALRLFVEAFGAALDAVDEDRWLYDPLHRSACSINDTAELPFDILTEAYATYQVQQGRDSRTAGVTRVARGRRGAAGTEDAAETLALAR